MSKLADYRPRTFQPAPLAGCICPEPLLVDGQVLERHDPNCLVPGHGCTWRLMAIEDVYFRDSRRAVYPNPPCREML